MAHLNHQIRREELIGSSGPSPFTARKILPMLLADFGPIIATACEAPFLLMAMLVAARWVPRVLNIRRDPKTLILVGIGALVLLQIADFAVGVWLRGITPTEQIAQFRTGQGNIYAALLVLFAIMPWAANWWLERLARTPR